MDTFVSFQPSRFCDKSTEDGTELYKTPYPLAYFIPGALRGRIVDERDFWQGRNDELVGFARDLNRQEVDLYFTDLAAQFPDNPDVFEQTVGMYLVIRDRQKKQGANVNAISSVTVYGAPQPTEPSAAPQAA